jgi:hypothetical protein
MRSPQLLYDPTWYRLEYALATQHLHAATEHREENAVDARYADEAEANEDQVRWIALEILRWPKDLPERYEQPDDLALAERHADRLLTGTANALQSSGYRWMREDPGWFTRLRRRKGPAIRPEFARFLERTVEPSTAIVLLSTRIERHGAFRFEGKEWPIWPALEQSLRTPPIVQFDRQRLAREQLGDRTLLDYLGRVNAGQRLDYRAWYTLACLFSRVAERDSHGQPSKGEESPRRSPLSWSLAKLESAMREAPSPLARDRLGRWGWRDPGLSYVRTAAPDEFARIVGQHVEIRVDLATAS